MLISDMVQEVLYEVPHAPHPLIETQLLKSAQYFCQRTRRWIVENQTLDTTVGTSSYTLSVVAQVDGDSNTIDHRIIGVEEIIDINDKKVTAFTYNDGTITFDDRIYDRTETLTIIIQLKPSLTADAIYDPLWEDYEEGIVSGAKFRMQRMPDVAWENQNKSKENKRIFDGEVHRCRTNKWNEDGSNELTRRLTGW